MRLSPRTIAVQCLMQFLFIVGGTAIAITFTALRRMTWYSAGLTLGGRAALLVRDGGFLFLGVPVIWFAFAVCWFRDDRKVPSWLSPGWMGWFLTGAIGLLFGYGSVMAVLWW
jgi:hypothetical protein